MTDNAAIAPPRIAFYDCRHGKIAHFAADACIGLALARYGEWGEDEIALLRDYIKPGDVVLDVGANVGTHALGFAELVGPTGRVIAIEGQPEVFELLCTNITNNGHAGVVSALNVLAGERLDLVKTKLFGAAMPDNAGARSFLYETRDKELPPWASDDALDIHLAMITLDSLALKRCDLIKIDVEGMEYEVLSGAEKILSEFHPIVYFEHASGDPEVIKAIDALIKPKGYRLFWHIANPYNAMNWKDDPQNIFGGMVEVNVLACPPGVDAPQDLAEITAENCNPTRPPLDVAIHGANIPVTQAQLDSKKDAPVSLAKDIYRRLTGRATSPSG